jgi:DNA-binding NarL/FixJ family response regulator
VTLMHLSRSLKSAGMVVVGRSPTGEGAVEIARRERPDLVLMDVRLAGAMDGLEAARRILEEQDTCLVVLSAHADDEILKEAMDIGVSGYIVKPVTMLDLVSILNQVLERRGK